MAFFSVLGLVYASFLPELIQNLSWTVAVEKFYSLPWLDLGVHSRADWVANALVVLPAGWFAAAAVDWGRRSRLGVTLACLPISLGLTGVVLAIEFAQAWCPMRTQSLNDVVAGIAGAVLGPLIWLAGGRGLVRGVLDIRQATLTKNRLIYGVGIYIVFNLVYAILPLDVMLQSDEWRQKYDAGRLILVPILDNRVENGSLRGWLLAAFRVAPVAYVVALVRGPKAGMAIAMLFAVTCELLQIPIFSRTASVMDLLASAGGVGLGLIAFRFRQLPVRWMKHASLWILLAFVSLILIVGRMLSRTERFIQSPEELATRWAVFWDWPMAKYYYMSEFEAGTVLVTKLSMFGWVGFCWCSAAAAANPRMRPVIHVIAAITVLCAATTIEIGQVYMPPQIPDAFDIVVYSVGAFCGCVGFWFVNPNRIRIAR